MSTLGKRKADSDAPETVDTSETAVNTETTSATQDASSETHGSTLFVSNLPYAATSVDLQTLFSDLAPVRTAFVVTEQGTGVSKGVGYVSFAAKEDAQGAFEQVQKEGLKITGRNLRVAWADIKKIKDKNADPSVKTEASSSKPPPRPKQPPAPRPPRSAADPLAIRTVVLSGLPADITKQVLWKKVRKCAGANDVEINEDSTSARILFNTPMEALAAVSKLHAHVFKGALLSATLKKRIDAVPGLSKTTASSSGMPTASAKSKAASRASRLIIRNLPWDITEQDLRALFLPYGPIHSVHIPSTKPEKLAGKIVEDGQEDKEADAKPRARGFAFVWMVSKPDAAKALEGVNGTTVRAGIAARMAEEKQKKKKELRLERKKALVAEGGEGEDGRGKAQEQEGAKERIVAVDWALSKNKWEEEKTRLEDQVDVDVDGDESMEGTSSGSSSSSSEGDSDEDGGLGVDDNSDSGQEGDSDEEGDDSERDDDEAPVKPQLPQTDVGTTLFVRNVPYEGTEDELRQLFRAFGPLRYARITIDPASGRGRGTGFACFWNKEDADKALAFSDTLRADSGFSGSSEKEKKKNPFKLPTLLTPDPSSSIAQSLVLHGRTLDLSRAVTRDEADKLKEQGERAREKKDKRNLYLLREGVITQNSPAAKYLPEAEVQKRVQSFDARRALLRSNPSLYVSKTRLSVRRLPLFVSERTLRKLAFHAVKTFDAEAKAGSRDGLHADELVVDEDDVEGQKAMKPRWSKGGKKIGGGPIKQAKIVRQQDRNDALTGNPRSKGYGFIEMRTHADALRVLRWANNNPAAIEHVQTLWKAELEELVKTTKDDDDEGKARKKRATEALEALEAGKGKKKDGTMIVEFSIENVQVIQRRSAREHDSREKPRAPRAPMPKLPDSVRSSEKHEGDRRPAKKAKTGTGAKSDSKTSSGDVENAGKGSHLGAMIGRKRKQKKAGKA